MQGDTLRVHVAGEFLAFWKGADPDIPRLKYAKTEYAKLSKGCKQAAHITTGSCAAKYPLLSKKVDTHPYSITLPVLKFPLVFSPNSLGASATPS